MRLRDVTLCTPNYANTLFEDLSLTVGRGERLLVMGPSGCGKTSLLRAIGGLWSSGEGVIETPPVIQAEVRPCVAPSVVATPRPPAMPCLRPENRRTEGHRRQAA